jgi:hypothetical protein
MFVQDSIPFQNGWQVMVFSGEAPVTDYSVYAVCLSGASVLASTAAESKGIPGNGSGYAKTECPSGSALTGGGFTNMDSTVTLNEVSVHGRLWLVHAYNLYVDKSRAEITAHAACLAYQ